MFAAILLVSTALAKARAPLHSCCPNWFMRRSFLMRHRCFEDRAHRTALRLLLLCHSAIPLPDLNVRPFIFPDQTRDAPKQAHMPFDLPLVGEKA
jgi:hypothetical protein